MSSYTTGYSSGYSGVAQAAYGGHAQGPGQRPPLALAHQRKRYPVMRENGVNQRYGEDRYKDANGRLVHLVCAICVLQLES